MALFGKKKGKTPEELEAEKAEAEFQAQYAAKQERKNVEKMIGEIDKSIQNFIVQAAEAKGKGYDDMYQKCISFIKVAKARKKQAEMFLFQMNAMQEMQNISKNSSALLQSMNNVMNTLGKLSIDKTVLIATQKDYQKAMVELDRQSQTIDSSMSSFEDFSANSEITGDAINDSSIEADIAAFMSSGAPSGGAAQGASASADSGMDYLKTMAGL